MPFLRSLLQILLTAFAPFLIVGAGALVMSIGITYSFTIIIWTGLVLIAVGLFWLLVIYFYYGGAG